VHGRVRERAIDAGGDRDARVVIEPVDGRVVEGDDGGGAVEVIMCGNGCGPRLIRAAPWRLGVDIILA